MTPFFIGHSAVLTKKLKGSYIGYNNYGKVSITHSEIRRLLKANELSLSAQDPSDYAQQLLDNVPLSHTTRAAMRRLTARV